MCCFHAFNRTLVRFISWLIQKLFFREVDAFNESRVPEHGAVIFVCAPHANQFMDPIVVGTACPRSRIGWLSAQKSVDRKFVGAFIRAMDGIGVKRPQDYKRRTPGTVITTGTKVTGSETRFSDIKAGEIIFFKNTKAEVRVASVESDTQCTLKSPLEEDIKEPTPIMIEPKIDQNEVYQRVYDQLRGGNCVGIFPEGGSHDRAQLLPLKAGVSIMALGAMAKYQEFGLQVRIVPVGLNYFAPHKFRSHAYVDFGDPISIDDRLVNEYKKGGPAKRAACGELMDHIYAGLSSVTVQARTRDELSLAQLTRRLYTPKKLSVDQKLELNRRFAQGFEKTENDPRVQKLLEQGRVYKAQLRAFHMKDYQVTRTATGPLRSIRLLVWRFLKLIVLSVLALPGLLIYWPVPLIANRISKRKAAEAVAASAVKEKGHDVIGTWKVMIGLQLIPLITLFYTGVVVFLVLWLDDVPLWAQIAAPLSAPVLLPWIGYGSIRYAETVAQIFYSFRPLVYSLCCCCNKGVASLRQQRKDLQRAIFNLVEEMGPEMMGAKDKEEWESMRIVKREDFNHRFSITEGGDGDEEKSVELQEVVSSSPPLSASDEAPPLPPQPSDSSEPLQLMPASDDSARELV